MKEVPASNSELFINDNGGRRSGTDRRQFEYLLHIPERRSGKDRRIRTDRRIKPRESN